MSLWTVLEDTDRRAASVEVLGRRPSLISWWIVWRRRQSGRSLNAPARPTGGFYGKERLVILRSPTRQSRYGDGAREAPNCSRRGRADPSLPPSLKLRRTGRSG